MIVPRNRFFFGDSREMFRHIPPKSVQMCITSPPYWGLRLYGDEPSVWGGDPCCAHEWVLTEPRRNRSENDATSEKQASNAGSFYNAQSGQYCARCGAWRGCLGLEPTPEMFIEHLRMIFDQVYRVLRDDGVMFLNMGDSYASGKGSCNNPGGGANSLGKERKEAEAHPYDRGNVSTLREVGLKPKDLCGVPWRTAFALQGFSVVAGKDLDGAAGMLANARAKEQWETVAEVEGMLRAWSSVSAFLNPWWVRKDVIWAKKSCMPESCKDRPTTAHEYIFMLAKSKDYYYDWFAVREDCESGPSDIKKMVEQKQRIGGKTLDATDPLYKANSSTNIGNKRGVGNPSGRNRRSVWEVSTQPSNWDFCAKCESYFEGSERSRIIEEYYCPICGMPYRRLKLKSRGRKSEVAKESMLFDVEELAEFDDREWEPVCDCILGEDERPGLRRYCPVCGSSEDWEGHFAMFPETLPEICIKAGTSEAGACPICGKPWKRILKEKRIRRDEFDESDPRFRPQKYSGAYENINGKGDAGYNESESLGFAPDCECECSEPVSCVVIDPFMGSGTTAIVAWRLGRDFIGFDSNKKYVALENARMNRLINAGKQLELEMV